MLDGLCMTKLFCIRYSQCTSDMHNFLLFSEGYQDIMKLCGVTASVKKLRLSAPGQDLQ
jgi:hypothetical protein